MISTILTRSVTERMPIFFIIRERWIFTVISFTYGGLAMRRISCVALGLNKQQERLPPCGSPKAISRVANALHSAHQINILERTRDLRILQ